MIKKLKITLFFICFATLLIFNIHSFTQEIHEVSLNSYEVTDEKYFTFSDYDHTNRTVSIAHNNDDTNHEHGSTLVLPSTHTLEGVTFDVVTIAEEGFYACDELIVLVLPSTIKTIDASAFVDCTSLTTIVFSDESSLETIKSSAFDGCTSLESLLLPEGVKSISSSAFRNCESLKILYLPKSLTSIGNGAFTSTNNLQSIYINSIISFSNSNVFDSSSCPIIIDIDCLSFYDSSKLNRFEDITNVVEVSIDLNGGNNGTIKEASVYKLFGLEFGYALDDTTGIWTYESNDNFTDLPSGLTKIEYNQELRLGHYTYVDELNTVEVIHSDVLVSEDLIESGLTAQYEGVFKTIYDELSQTHVITGISNSFQGSILDLTIYESYFDGVNNGKIKEIAANAFEGMTFTNVTFENGLTTIGSNSFKDVKVTASSVITIPSSVKFIDDYAFDSLSGVDYIYLNEECDYGTDVFNNVTSLIIVSSEEVYNDIKNDINNTNLNYLIYITLDFNEGLYEQNTNLVLTRLNGKSLKYIQQSDLTWDLEGYSLPAPTKTNYIFNSYVLANAYSLINENSVFTTNTTLTALYDLQIVSSEASDTSISGSLYFADGIASNATLSIELNSNSSLSSSVSDLDIYGIYSINLLSDGVSINPGYSSYKLSILLPEDMGEVVKYTIYMMDNGVLKEIEGVYNNGYIDFELTSLGDFALLNETVFVALPTVSESLLVAILVMSLVNIIEFACIFQLNKGKRKTIIASCNVLPLITILSVNNISLSILIALSATAIAQGIYIVYLFATRNDTIHIQKQVESIAASSVSLEELEDIITQSRKTIEELNAEYTAQEEYREILSLDGEDDEDLIEEDEVDEDEVDEEEVRTQLNATGQMVVVRFKKSFSARLNLTEDINKDYHTVIKNKLLSYKKVNCRISWNHEAYNFGRSQAAKINVRGRTLFVYLPLNPKDYVDSKISFKDCSYIKKYEQLPFRLKIKSKRAVKNALELIELVMSNFNTTEKKKFEMVSYYQKNRGFEKLMQEGLIKEIISAKEYDEIKELNKILEDNPNEIENNNINPLSTRRNVMVRRTVFVEESPNNIVPKNIMVRRPDVDNIDSSVKLRPLVRPKFTSTKDLERKPLVKNDDAQTVTVTSPFKLFEEKQEKLRTKALENMNKENV